MFGLQCHRPTGNHSATVFMRKISLFELRVISSAELHVHSTGVGGQSVGITLLCVGARGLDHVNEHVFQPALAESDT